jgi:ferritin-like metal-binding protein YciE
VTSRQQKVLQYLDEAYSSERALERVLTAQIAMAPAGSSYRAALETHLVETQSHGRRIRERARALGQAGGVTQAATRLAQSAIAQALALGKTPLDLLRGHGGEEKALKNAKDACATEMLEIATYTAIERVARQAGDDETARLAATIRSDEERMLTRLLDEIPVLADLATGRTPHARPPAAARAELTRSVAAASAAAAAAAQRTAAGAERNARKLRPAVAAELAIPNYERLTAGEVNALLAGLAPDELDRVEAFERRHRKRSRVLRRIAELRGAAVAV